MLIHFTDSGSAKQQVKNPLSLRARSALRRASSAPRMRVRTVRLCRRSEGEGAAFSL
jgi:hypothetical protein